MSRVSETIKKFRPEVKIKEQKVEDQDKTTLRYAGKPLTPDNPMYEIIKGIVLKRRGIYK